MVDEEGKTLVVMEYADCGSLHSYLYDNGEQKPNYKYTLALEWMHQLAKVKPEKSYLAGRVSYSTWSHFKNICL